MTDDRHLGHTTPGFPILDADRQGDNTMCVRTIFDVHGYVEPYIPEMDSWVSMPLRLAHSQSAGFYLELGPYDLDAADIRRLREALDAYDRATVRR
jgi:hypothetical protein